MKPKFKKGDKVKFQKIKDDYFYDSRKGSIGIVESIGVSLGKVCYWTKFKNETIQVYEYQLKYHG